MAFLCLAVLRRASASTSSSPPFMIKACCCADRSGGVKKPERSWMYLLPLRWPSKLNDLLTQIYWANTSVIYMEGGRGGSGWSLDFASVVCLLFMSDFKQGMNVYECMSTCVCAFVVDCMGSACMRNDLITVSICVLHICHYWILKNMADLRPALLVLCLTDRDEDDVHLLY